MKVNMRGLDRRNVLISLCIVHLLALSEGRPVRKRAVSEVQLMHDLGALKQARERRQWLQRRLQGAHAGLTWGGAGEAGRAGRRERPEEPPELSGMTPEEIQLALNLLERLLKSKPS
uniref:parathyroid hormone 1a n=1 Tax=Gasterosteus aculeatus aculeatus TaxID=481459 RepID=UPI001A97EF8A|nr:parathyroid hormone 1a [Gasterosteus aculeatus aculeatus]